MASDSQVQYLNDRQYAATHEWVKLEGDAAVVGISDYAQDALGDVVFLELPGLGRALNAREPFGVIESVKAASDVYAPVGGTVSAVNEALVQSPETVNRDAFGADWLIKLSPFNSADLGALLSADEYKRQIESREIH